MAGAIDGHQGERRRQQGPSLDALVTHALLCRTELAFLHLSMRRLSSSPSWTSAHQEHLEILEELLRRESADTHFDMAAQPAASLVHLRAKAGAVRELCDLDATDLHNMLTRSLCDDVLALASCCFETNNCG